MVPEAITRLAKAAGSVAVVVALALGTGPAAATAAPKPLPKPTSIQIEGKGIEDTLVVQQSGQARLFDNLLGEVNWMAGAKPHAVAPKADALGPKFVLTVMIKTVPTQVYDLYPMAAGGPRAYRPANQPSGKKAAGWFYGRLTMSETLRVSGVPLEARPDVVAGGIGGGVGVDIGTEAIDPATEMNNFLDEMRRVLLLNGAVLIVILCGLAGIAYLIRRRI
ncbi:hypothetical protein [Paractinoplanes rishiriensis]|uniref:Uncharacterized protein n=1 Tax=Paractinoplanes rishiriensis TaxID=1050105 RepID=A0A919MUW6_9ACTN|nr:hypothetical protein [Actinoplanes rishiriensis]GIF00762.1 hypothetical protein Ari01nite_82260 [Actinoplanes rishiriensis]